jgi:hypothetical protein
VDREKNEVPGFLGYLDDKGAWRDEDVDAMWKFIIILMIVGWCLLCQ